MAKRNRYFEDEKTRKIDKRAIKDALKFTTPYKKLILKIFLAMIVMSFIALLPTRILAYIVDYVLAGKGVQIWGVEIKWATLAIMLIGAYALAEGSNAVFSYFRTKMMAKVGHSIVHDMRYSVYDKLQRLAFDYYDSRPNGKILVRATTYLDELSSIYSSGIVSIVVDALKIIFIVVWLLLTDFRLALVILACIVPMTILLSFVRMVVAKRRRKHRDKNSNRTAYIAESIQGHLVTNAFNRKDKNMEIFDDLNKQRRKTWVGIISVHELIHPIMSGMFQIGITLVYWLAFFLITGETSSLTVGLLISFISYSSMLPTPLNNISAQLQEVMTAIANLESVMEVLHTEPTVKDKENAEEMGEIQGEVEFDKVCFGYEKGQVVLDNVSFSVPKGKTIAIVGPTGAGKTTIVNLINRFYNVNSGKVLIDGRDINDFTLYSLRKQIGVMMQDSFIFSGTIIENIRYGRQDATDEECITAAKLVGAHDFISALPNGYYTETVEQGARLSTGQRQLISFARVLLINPKILILDEATASIDSESEELIQKALAVVCSGRTSFVVAHRLSTIKNADCIFYIANHTIAEAGTHESLMDEKGLYYDLVSSSKNNIVK